MNAAIPEDVVTPEQLAEWYEVQQELSRLKQKESLMRSRIYKFFFKEPKEGTNKVPLNDGTGAELKAQRVIDRKVDPGTLDALREAQRVNWGEGHQPGTLPNVPKLALDKLVKWKPELSVKDYRELSEEERIYFDQCLIIKDGSPQLEIVIPKRASA